MGNGEYGISAIKLVFTIAILAVFITGIVFLVQRLWEDTSVKDVETDLLYIKAKCKVINDKHIIDENQQLLGENIKEYPENEEVNKIVSQSDKWYKLTQENLEEMGIGVLKAEDGYLINYEEEDIIYAKGIERDKEIYYRLSDLQNVELQEEQEEQEQQNTEIQQQETTENSNATEETNQQESLNPETQVLEGH